jgi:tRNA nucleotidyltransferase (CCA-adding enzyme)
MKKKSMNSVLKEQISKIKPDKKTFKELNAHAKEFKDALAKVIGDSGIDAEVFIGGSFAKGTLLRKEKYDIDVFVRFDWKYENLSKILKPVLEKMASKGNFRLETVHGSRDYFMMFSPDREVYFEIIPVTKIRRPKEERNVTDLSYFHVPYVRKKIKGVEEQVLLSKSFCHAQKVYGAETYVQGFSGYALECLVIHYKSFARMLRELSKVKQGDRIVVDTERHYKRKHEVFFEMNQNKLNSPVILVDPTYKERNALAALSRMTFEKFQESARAFLKNPSLEFFSEKEIDVVGLKKKAAKKKAEFLHLKLETDKQPGDIAGTKMKKFSEFLARETGKYFEVLEHEFDYGERQESDLYLVAKSKKEIVRIGPPLRMKDHVKAFKREHKKTYEKNGILHAKIKVDFTAKEFVEKFVRERADTLKEMDITRLEVLEN